MNRLLFLRYFIPGIIVLKSCTKDKNETNKQHTDLQLKFPISGDYLISDCINPIIFEIKGNTSTNLVELFDSSQSILLTSGTGKEEVWLNIPKIEKNTTLLLVINGTQKLLVNVNKVNGQPVSLKEHLTTLIEGKNIAITQTDGIPFTLSMKKDFLFDAINMICTHNGCPINLQPDNSFICNCHGSKFNSNGVVLNGPAIENLGRFTWSYAERNKIVIVNNYL